jgi:hypothetical protein
MPGMPGGRSKTSRRKTLGFYVCATTSGADSTSPSLGSAVLIAASLVPETIVVTAETVVEPLHDRNRKPYYHRRIGRVPEIDECGVNDLGCIYEANEQYRLDK